MTPIGAIRAAAIAAIVSLCVASCKPQLRCQLASGGDWFPVPGFSDVSLAAAAVPGSLGCDVVYRIDKRDYVIGGCNRDSVGLWAKKEGRPRPGTERRQLICKE